MHNLQIKEAKELFLKTGRLNYKVVKEEIAKSWYRCNLIKMKRDDTLKYKVENKISQNSLSNFARTIINLFDTAYNIYICDQSGLVIEKNINDSELDIINNIDEAYIGTNAGIISLRTESLYKISLEEHYLDIFCKYYTYGLPIKTEDNFIGVCLIITEIEFSDFELFNKEQQIRKIQNDKSNVGLINEKKNAVICIEDFLVYPDEYYIKFKDRVRKMLEMKLPILIQGDKGSGKTSLANYLAMTEKGKRFSFNASEMPQILHYNEILNGLFQYETVIVENFEFLDSKTMTLLTVYTDEKIIGTNGNKYSNYKCSKLILSTVYTTVNELNKLNINKRLIEKIKNNSIVLKNLEEFENERDSLIKKLILNQGVNCTNEFIIKLKRESQGLSFKEVVEIIRKSVISNVELNIYDDFHIYLNRESSICTLDQMERDYIQKVIQLCDFNITLASEMMKISRSTLYRKIEKYQIATKAPN